jgi:K+-transporting ATPase ATPase A chain
MTEAGRAGIANPGAHGFAEVLYAFSSAGNNYGSAFAGLGANTPPSTTRCWALPCGSGASA